MNRTMLRVVTQDAREGYRVRYDATGDYQVTWWAQTDQVGLKMGDAEVSLTGDEAEWLSACLTAALADRRRRWGTAR